MTTDWIALMELPEESGDTEFLHEMLSFVAVRPVALETEGLCGARLGERIPDRIDNCNGYRDRRWENGSGTLDLRIPKLSEGELLPGLSQAAQDRREGPGGGDPGVLRPAVKAGRGTCSAA